MKRETALGGALLLFAASLTSASLWVAPATPTRLKALMSAEEFEQCGLHKLTASELARLEQWLANHSAATSARAAAPRAGLMPQLVPVHELVSFNVASGKYHCRSCPWALRCTRNCVARSLDEARVRGVPCKVCGGSCR
jgi:hypothetical protein